MCSSFPFVKLFRFPVVLLFCSSDFSVPLSCLLFVFPLHYPFKFVRIVRSFSVPQTFRCLSNPCFRSSAMIVKYVSFVFISSTFSSSTFRFFRSSRYLVRNVRRLSDGGVSRSEGNHMLSSGLFYLQHAVLNLSKDLPKIAPETFQKRPKTIPTIFQKNAKRILS